jgi:hypothetical protein
MKPLDKGQVGCFDTSAFPQGAPPECSPPAWGNAVCFRHVDKHQRRGEYPDLRARFTAVDLSSL